jgi:cytosine deaminase
VGTLPRPVPLLTDALLPDGSRVDVELAGGTVTAIRPAGNSTPRTGAVDLEGYLLLAAPAEPHAHLGSTGAGTTARPSPVPSEDQEEQIAAAARSTAMQMLRNGTTAIRSHVDLHPDGDRLRSVRALVRVREELAGLVDLQLVALGTRAGGDGPADTDPDDALLDEALDLGMDLVGGAPHLASDPLAELRRLVATAKRRKVGLDLHIDEVPDRRAPEAGAEAAGGPLSLPQYARLVRGWTRPVSAANCRRLAELDDDDLTEILTDVLASDLGIIALVRSDSAPGTEHRPSPGGPFAPLRALVDRGVRIAGGGAAGCAVSEAGAEQPDGHGRGHADALGTARLLAVAGPLSAHEAYAAVSQGARSVMGLPLAGISVGEQAEFLAVRAGGLADALAHASPDRMVIHGGRLVAQSPASPAASSPWASASSVPASVGARR